MQLYRVSRGDQLFEVASETAIKIKIGIPPLLNDIYPHAIFSDLCNFRLYRK